LLHVNFGKTAHVAKVGYTRAGGIDWGRGKEKSVLGFQAEKSGCLKRSLTRS